MLSEKIIDCKFQDSQSSWLDGEFLEKAFKPSVKSKMIITHVCNNELAAGTSYGNTDKRGTDCDARIFLLSFSEEWNYRNVVDSGKKICTDYARALDAEDYKWWLRTQAGRNLFGVSLGQMASGWNDSANVCSKHGIVPALWINF